MRLVHVSAWSERWSAAGAARAIRIAEALLLIGFALVLARLVWTIFQPINPIGDWYGSASQSRTQRTAILREFDPFSRSSGPSVPTVVTPLQLTLYGIRLNEAAGTGSAIIGTPDGEQRSYATGEEIMAGVTLKSVAFDSITLSRGGVDEQLFITDAGAPSPSSSAATGATTATATDDTLAGSGQGGVTLADIRSGIAFTPRIVAGRLTGFALGPQGDGNAFRNAGFRPGDVLVAADGKTLSSAADIEQMMSRMERGGTISVSVERGADIVPIAITVRAQ